MGNRYAGTAHQHSPLAGRGGPARDTHLPGPPASTEAESSACAPRSVHRGRRNGTRNVETV